MIRCPALLRKLLTHTSHIHRGLLCTGPVLGLPRTETWAIVTELKVLTALVQGQPGKQTITVGWEVCYGVRNVATITKVLCREWTKNIFLNDGVFILGGEMRSDSNFLSLFPIFIAVRVELRRKFV